MAARDQIRNGEYVVFKVDDFYEFCRKLWNHAADQMGGKPRAESIEDLASSLVMVDRPVNVVEKGS